MSHHSAENSRSVLKALYEKTGGFITGICHPREQYDKLTDAGIRWVRRDVPFPVKADGTFTEHHIRFLEETREYAKHGIRSVLVSPYPREYIHHGIDPRTKEGLAAVEQISKKLAEAYAGLGVCWQATNEMFVVHFRAPLTKEESLPFVAASIRGLRAGDPEAAVGHNSVITAPEWVEYGHALEKEASADYIGFDLYNGTWGGGGPETYIHEIERLYELFGKPIILMEFGFASLGRNLSHDSPEIPAYYRSLGFSGFDDILAHTDIFAEKLPAPLRHTLEHCAPEDRTAAIHSMTPHLLKAWICDMVFPHTDEGQVQFYKTLLPMLLENEHLGGAVIYCWQDSETCYTCGASDCPCETAWGITRCDKTLKPAYYAIKDIFTTYLSK